MEKFYPVFSNTKRRKKRFQTNYTENTLPVLRKIELSWGEILLCLHLHKSAKDIVRAGILEQSMGARNRVGTELSNRPASQCS